MQKIVYLLGSGATQSELQNIGWYTPVLLNDLKEPFHTKAMENPRYAKIAHGLGIPINDIDIEQMISLLDDLEETKDQEFAGLSEEIRQLFFKEILNNLIKDGKMAYPRNLKLLLLLHNKYSKFMGKEEIISGILTVNFDSLIDQACESVHGCVNYGVSAESSDLKIANDAPELLKLHGSFNWSKTSATTLVVEKNLEYTFGKDSLCLPPSVYKRPSLQKFPYNEIWQRARTILEDSDILRIVGCSLRKEDWPLISLIFTSQVRSRSKFAIELIVPDSTAEVIKENFRFLGKIQPSNYTTADAFGEWVARKYEEIADQPSTRIGEDETINNILGGR